MNQENRETTIQPVKDDELEKASGGLGIYRKKLYICTSCDWRKYEEPIDGKCPCCGSPIEAKNVIQNFPVG